MCSFGSSSGSSHQDQSAYGTNTPTLSPQYQSIFNSFAKSFGFDPSQWAAPPAAPPAADAKAGPTAQPGQGSPQPKPATGAPATTPADASATNPNYKGPDVQFNPNMGMNGTQSSAVDWLRKSLTDNTVGNQVTATNKDLTQANDWNKIVGNRINAIASADAPQSAGAPSITGQVGADYMGRYLSPFMSDVVGSTGDIMDRTTDRGLNALRASRDSGSAFGDRANLGDGQFLSDSAMNKGNVIANLKNLGFTQAAGYGMTDAGANQGAQTQNAANTLNNNQFNVNATLQQRQIANTANQQALEAISNYAGISKDILSGVVTADGISAAKANQLFTDGTISSTQLAALLTMAGAGNGYKYTQNATSDGTTDNTSVVI